MVGAPYSSCARRYSSYDPASATFLGRDGRRHACE
nr:BA14K family protein [Bradyrhizobium diazoefficiens]